METIDPVSIEKIKERNPSLDFAVLRQQSIDLLQKLSGKTWTDFNLHDPGITILEQLCYAITDLVYRTGFSIEDILTGLDGRISKQNNSFFGKEHILTTNPITINDFRKVILDEVSEVSNVQLEPMTSQYSADYIKGLYKILVQVDQSTVRKFQEQPQLEDEIINRVKTSFLNRRNLSEDMVRKIVILKPKSIYVSAQVIIQEHILPEEILAKIYHRIEMLLCPVTKHYSEKELVDAGMSIEQIYSGPLLKHGIIPDSELKPLKKEIEPSEILREISKVEGVQYVKYIAINADENNAPGKPFDLPEGYFPLLETDDLKKGVQLFSDKYELEIKDAVFKNIYSNYTSPTHVHRKPTASELNPDPVKGIFRNTEQYYSIQNQFPITYGIGKEGLSVNDTAKRKAQAKQLKAYLLFFEQLLADYLSQLAHIGQLFSADLGDGNQRTYYSQPLKDVPGIENLLQPYMDSMPANKKNELQDFKAKAAALQPPSALHETKLQYQDRKNKLFDHLLARFNQRLSIYPVILYNSTYNTGTEEERNTTLLAWKAEILRTVSSITYNRVKAFNYADKVENTSGFEKKMFTLLHILHKRNRPLSEIFTTKNNFFAAKKDNSFVAPYTTYKVDISEKEILDPDVFIEAEELKKLVSENDSELDTDKKTSFVFKEQTITLLKYGIDIKNYRIGPDSKHEDNYVILYKEPHGKKWVTISTHDGKSKAAIALLKLMGYLKKMSTQSEGFHMIEHLLLRPSINNNVFGFEFHRDNHTVDFENDQFTGFEKREEVIASILSAVDETTTENIRPQNVSTASVKVDKYKAPYTLNITDLANEKKYPTEKDFKNMVTGLKQFKEEKAAFFPRFDMTVQLSNGTLIKEDFFNFRITVVLPSWPARFQDQEFKNFVEDLFVLNAPVYLRVNFIWMDISEMIRFENSYFRWLDVLKNNEPDAHVRSLSEELISFIKKDSFNVTH